MVHLFVYYYACLFVAQMKLRGEANLRIGNKQLHPESPLSKPKIKKLPLV